MVRHFTSAIIVLQRVKDNAYVYEPWIVFFFCSRRVGCNF